MTCMIVFSVMDFTAIMRRIRIVSGTNILRARLARGTAENVIALASMAAQVEECASSAIQRAAPVLDLVWINALTAGVEVRLMTWDVASVTALQDSLNWTRSASR